MKKVLLCEPNISEGVDLALVNEVLDPDTPVRGNQNPGCLLRRRPQPLGVHLPGRAAGCARRPPRRWRGKPSSGSTCAPTTALTRAWARWMWCPLSRSAGWTWRKRWRSRAQFGRFVGGLGVPVYYYEEAATAAGAQEAARYPQRAVRGAGSQAEGPGLGAR